MRLIRQHHNMREGIEATASVPLTYVLMFDRAGIIISLAMLIVASEARDRGQFAKSTPEMKAWFDSLKSGKGFLCCSDADGTAVSDVDWESKDGHYRVRLGGQWIDVPDDALVTVPNRAGRTMVWPMPMIEGDTIKIRCFMPGSMI
jgi:hypothetical protein